MEQIEQWRFRWMNDGWNYRTMDEWMEQQIKQNNIWNRQNN